MEIKDEFLETTKESIEHLGIWREEYKSTVIAAIEKIYKKNVTDKWQITDIVMNGDNILVKWIKKLDF